MEIKSTWHKIAREDIQQEFEMLVQRAHDLGLFDCHFRNYTCVGLFYSSRKACMIGSCYTNYRSMEWCVVLNKGLLECSIDKVRQVLVHEIAHACDPTDNHGRIWKSNANALGAKWGYEAERLCHEEEILNHCEGHKERKYAIQCPCCGSTWKYRIMCKAVQSPERYRCGKCKEKLVRVQ